MLITLYNTLTRTEETFVPLDADNIRMYVCGPTVYDQPHIGNARAVVVYDLLYRLLRHHYPRVTYVRNITDVDDKIIAAAKHNQEPIHQLTERIAAVFHENMHALHCLPPSYEPKATEHIGEMISMIETLIHNGCAYLSKGHVYFDVASYPQYGLLSGRKQEDMIAGSRVEISAHKRHPADFVLWKPAETGDDASSAFESPWGTGRPGWHIECSAMSHKYLGDSFDIHGGGADLMFPHHTNEIAQSRCAHPNGIFANYWVHNGFLTVNGEKMSKSLGNFITVNELLQKGVKGEAIRYVLLATHYRKPLDFSDKALDDATKALDGFYRAVQNVLEDAEQATLPHAILSALEDDLNTPEALAFLHGLAKQIHKTPDISLMQTLKKAANFLGLLYDTPEQWFKQGGDAEVETQIEARIAAKKNRDFAEADRIRDVLKQEGIILEDTPDGKTTWRKL